MIKIYIDNTELAVRPGTTIIEAADSIKIPIPRFCYHPKLSIAANCRMCLVEVANTPKLLPACATVAMDGMQIFTQSDKTLNSQKNVMEFLLINHPLDCPVCDQGGECELQDLSMSSGKDYSRYIEPKRAVTNPNLGPLVATELTRCIHCTRCVRFGEEVAGVRGLGMINRGEHAKITSFLANNINSEVSANIIDLCPVGALTSKPYQFSNRAWELKQVAGVSPHDCLGSNVFYHTHNNQIKRVVPRENANINSIWLSDRDRFAYQGYNSIDRLKHPIIKKQSKWLPISWEQALDVLKTRLQEIIKQYGAEQIGALVSPSTTVEEGYLIQKFFRHLGSNNIDHRLRQQDFRNQDMAPLYPNMGISIAELKLQNTILLVGSYINKQQPILGIYLRTAQKNGAKISAINLMQCDYNFALTNNILVENNDLVTSLLKIAKACSSINNNLPVGANVLLENIEFAAQDLAIAKDLFAVKSSILLGINALTHSEYSRIVAIVNLICILTNAKLGLLPDGANQSGLWIAGCVPHRDSSGNSVKNLGKNALQMQQENLKAYGLFAIEPELDCVLGTEFVQSLSSAKFNFAFTAYESESLLKYCDLLLPIALFCETLGTYVNIEGTWQSFPQAVDSLADSKPCWKVINVIAKQFGFFDYKSTGEIITELKLTLANAKLGKDWQWWCPNIDKYVVAKILSNSQLGLYKLDPMVRRANSLQQTKDAKC